VAAFPIDVAQTKTRIKKSLVVEVKFELMGAMLQLAHPALSSALLQAAARQKRLKILLSSGLAFGGRGVHWVVKLLEVVPTHEGLAGQPISHSAPGVKHTLDARR
jgi:hypothetical protein